MRRGNFSEYYTFTCLAIRITVDCIKFEAEYLKTCVIEKCLLHAFRRKQ